MKVRLSILMPIALVTFCIAMAVVCFVITKVGM